MYAVIQTGGKQYRVRAGDVIVVEKLDGDVGAEMTFDTVLMMGGDKGVSMGSALKGATVSATLIETRKGDKVKVFKKIRRQGYRRTQGHRQFESVLRITGLEGGGQSMKWDGAVDLTPRSELLLRARALATTAPTAAPKAAEKKTTAKAAKAAPVADDETAMMDTPVSEQPAEKPAKAAAKAPKTEAETAEAAPVAKKAKAAKAEAAPAASEEAAPKKAAAPNKPKAAPKADK